MNILAIGAFERDNFGDELFLLVTEKLLNKHNVVPASLVASDMKKIFNRRIFSYHDLLDKYKWDLVIVCGGEVGNARLLNSLPASVDSTTRITTTKLLKIVDSSQDYGERFKSLPRGPLAYVPLLSRYEKNKDTPLVLNSVGGFDALAGEKYEAEVLGQLKDSMFISVRDKESHDYLLSKGISSMLAPDVVHSYKLDGKGIEKSKYITFQISKKIFKKSDVKEIASQLIDIANMYDSDIHFVPAGLAHGHDDIACYKEIEEAIRNKLGNKDIYVEVFQKRNPEEIAMHIANSSLWIGSSLHGRIIASVARIDRISIAKEKLNEYCSFWDDNYPYKISVAELHSTAKKMTLEQKKDNNKNDLTSLSEKRNKELASRISKIKGKSELVSPKIATSNLNKELQDYLEQSLMSALEEKTNALKDAEKMLRKKERDIEELKLSIEEVKGSFGWKFSNRLKRLIKRS